MYQIVSIPYSECSEPLYRSLRVLNGAIWFDSGKPDSEYGRYDIITAEPSATLTTGPHGSEIVDSNNCKLHSEQDPFSLARDLLKSMPELPEDIAQLPFVGGLAGYFNYDLGKTLEQVPAINSAAVELPDLRLGLYHWSLIVDHHKRSSRLIFLESCPPETVDTVERLIVESTPSAGIADGFRLTSGFTPSMNQASYNSAIKRIHDYIKAGDCYQVNFAQHFSAPYEGDTLSAYAALRSALPSPFSAYMEWNGQALLSLSPERFLEVSSTGAVETKPIKGTLRRGTDPEMDKRNAAQLLNSPKDRSENLMIVDLLRNDLGKSCRPGSINVPKLFALESFANVHHLVSTVTGELEEHKDSIDLLKGCFPGGSITGAPKRRAMEIIEELEQNQRSIYCGSIGYISRCGRMDTSIAIRTMVADSGRLHCWGGGGIVADSVADAEYQESIDKVDVLMKTLAKLNRD